MKDVRGIVYKIENLPTLPTIVSEVTRLLKDPLTSASDVSKVISEDQSLSARVLKLVNSAFYGFPERISSINHALVILGFRAVEDLVLMASVFNVFSKDSGGADFSRAEFWKHAIGCAVAAKIIGEKVRVISAEDLFVAGLLHDIGKVVLDQYMHNDFKEIVGVVKARDILMAEAEKMVLGVTHAEVGGWLAERWGLPSWLVKVIRFHHQPEAAGDSFREAAAINLADILCRAKNIGSGGDNKMPSLKSRTWEELKLPLSSLEPIMKGLSQQVKRTGVFLALAREGK